MNMKHAVNTKYALAALALGVAPAPVVFNSAAPANSAPPGAQKVTVMLPAGYKSGAATVKAGKPVALTFHLTKDAGCGNEVVVPAANWRRTLKVGEKATVTFTPKKSGPLAFSCGMGMYKGTLAVR
jgi:plastocyanin domain-containing protein